MAERIIPGARSWAHASRILASWSARHAGALLIWIGEAIEPAPLDGRCVAPAVADAPAMPAELSREPLAEPVDARPPVTPAPAPVKRRGRPPKAKPIASAEPMAEPAEPIADCASPVEPVPEMAEAHPVPEMAEVVAMSEDTRSADGASIPVVETAGEKPLGETAGKPRRKGRAKRTPIPENLRKKASTLNDRMSGDAQCCDSAVQAVKYAARILQKRGLLPDDTSACLAHWSQEESTVTFRDRRTGVTVSHKIPDYVMSYDPTRALVSIETDAAPEVCNLSDARRRGPTREFEVDSVQIAA